MTKDDILWKATGVGCGVGAGIATRMILVALWRRITGRRPPENPAGPDTTWVEALTWAAASGVTVAVMRMVAERGAAGAWKAATGSYPDALADQS